MKDLKDLFVPYDIAIMAKDAGFNEACLGWIAPDGFLSMGIREVTNSQCTAENYSAPLYQQLIDWFREEHKIHLVPIEDNSLYSFTIKWHNGVCFNEMPVKGGEYYHALTAALKEAFKLINK